MRESECQQIELILFIDAAVNPSRTTGRFEEFTKDTVDPEDCRSPKGDLHTYWVSRKSIDTR